MDVITNKSQIIDYNKIKKCCEKIKNIAVDFETSAKNVKYASNRCTAEVISVDGLTFQPDLDDLSEAIKSIKGKIDEFADSIDNVGSQVYKKQMAQLEEYKKEQKKKQEKQKKQNKK